MADEIEPFRPLFRWDPVITLGHLIAVVPPLVMIVAAFVTADARINQEVDLRARLEATEQRDINELRMNFQNTIAAIESREQHRNDDVLNAISRLDDKITGLMLRPERPGQDNQRAR